MEHPKGSSSWPRDAIGAVLTPEGWLTLAPATAQEAPPASPAPPKAAALGPQKGEMWLSLTAAGPGEEPVVLPRDHLRNAALLSQLRADLAEGDARIFSSFAFTRDGTYYEPGLTVALPQDTCGLAEDYRRVLQLAAHYGQHAICVYTSAEPCDAAATHTLKIVSVADALQNTNGSGDSGDSDDAALASQAVTVARLSAADASAFHGFPPAAFHVYKALGDVRLALQQARLFLSDGQNASPVPEGKVRDLIEAIDTTLAQLAQAEKECSDAQQPRTRPPLVVLEGLDGTGKTTLAHNLQQQHGFTSAATPPAWAAALRPAFDTCGLPHLRRAFYSACNYAAAMSTLQSSAQPIVLDRFAYSTAAYAVGAALRGPEALPPPDSRVWHWPADLLPRPSLVVHLRLSPKDRALRVARRASSSATPMTDEEVQLAEDTSFERAVDAALAMSCAANAAQIPTLTLDAALSCEALVDKVIEALAL